MIYKILKKKFKNLENINFYIILFRIIIIHLLLKLILCLRHFKKMLFWLSLLVLWIIYFLLIIKKLYKYAINEKKNY